MSCKQNDIYYDNLINYDLAEKAGLVPVGRNKDGEWEYIGTEEQWNKYDELLTLKE